MNKPKFDKEGYQVNIEDINDEPLPHLKSAKIFSRKKAGLPSVVAVKKALSKLEAPSPLILSKTRKKLRISQEIFAKAIGVKLATYQQWGTGTQASYGAGESTAAARRQKTRAHSRVALIWGLLKRKGFYCEHGYKMMWSPIKRSFPLLFKE